MFAPGKPLQSSILFMGKTRSGAPERCFICVGSCLTCKHSGEVAIRRWPLCRMFLCRLSLRLNSYKKGSNFAFLCKSLYKCHLCCSMSHPVCLSGASLACQEPLPSSLEWLPRTARPVHLKVLPFPLAFARRVCRAVSWHHSREGGRDKCVSRASSI